MQVIDKYTAKLRDVKIEDMCEIGDVFDNNHFITIYKVTKYAYGKIDGIVHMVVTTITATNTEHWTNNNFEKEEYDEDGYLIVGPPLNKVTEVVIDSLPSVEEKDKIHWIKNFYMSLNNRTCSYDIDPRMTSIVNKIVTVHIPVECVIKYDYLTIGSITYNQNCNEYIVAFKGEEEDEVVTNIEQYLESCNIYVLDSSNQKVIDYLKAEFKKGEVS